MPIARSLPRPADAGFLRSIGDVLRAFVRAAFDPYRPELHYMRGPGPACRARDAASPVPGAQVMRTASQGVPAAR